MEKIGRHVYNQLKTLGELTDPQIIQVEEYEKRKGISRTYNDAELKYLERLNQKPIESNFSISPEKLYQDFIFNFEIVNGKKFILTEDSKHNLAVLCLYFSNDDRFFSAKRLTNLSKPSFEKGLLIIGSYGNGKSSMIETFRLILQSNPSKSFKSASANQLVEDYESCQSPDDKKHFWKNVTTGRFHFGDVKTERVTNNYGKMNLYKDVIEKRYENRPKTFIDCNYDEGGDLESGLDEFGLKYGSRVYDRLPEMFNIIEFKGKSFRI